MTIPNRIIFCWEFTQTYCTHTCFYFGCASGKKNEPQNQEVANDSLTEQNKEKKCPCGGISLNLIKKRSLTRALPPGTGVWPNHDPAETSSRPGCMVLLFGVPEPGRPMTRKSGPFNSSPQSPQRFILCTFALFFNKNEQNNFQRSADIQPCFVIWDDIFFHLSKLITRIKSKRSVGFHIHSDVESDVIQFERLVGMCYIVSLCPTPQMSTKYSKISHLGPCQQKVSPHEYR